MNKIRHMEIESGLALLEMPIDAAENRKARKLKIDGLQFAGTGGILAILASNKNNFLFFNPESKEITIFNDKIDKLHLLIRQNGVGGKNWHDSFDELEDFKEIAAALIEHFQEIGEYELCAALSRKIKDHSGSKKFASLLESPPCVLDLMHNLIDDPSARFYPFHNCENEYGFIPDADFSLPFEDFFWKDDEITLSARADVPGRYRFRGDEHAICGLPDSIKTFSNVCVNLIKNGRVCFEKIWVSVGGKFGYLTLSDCSVNASQPESLSLDGICEVVHHRNMFKVCHLLLSHLRKTNSISPCGLDVRKAFKRHFETFTKTQRQFLSQHRISENGYVPRSVETASEGCFTVIENEFDVFLKYLQMALNGDFEHHDYLFSIFSDFIEQIIPILLESCEPSEIDSSLWRLRKQINVCDSQLQRIRFYLTYNFQDFFDKGSMEAKYDSFNFLLQNTRYSNA